MTLGASSGWQALGQGTNGRRRDGMAGGGTISPLSTQPPPPPPRLRCAQVPNDCSSYRRLGLDKPGLACDTKPMRAQSATSIQVTCT